MKKEENKNKNKKILIISIIIIILIFTVLYFNGEKEYKKIILDSNNLIYYVIKAQAYYDHKRIIDSRIWAEKVIDKDPENIKANILLAWIFLIGENHEAVMKYANTALKTDPYNAEAYLVKGMSYKDIGNFKGATSNFRTATEQDNDYFEAWLQLGLLYDIADDPLAAEFYKNALRIDSNNLDALYDYGLHLQNRDLSYPAMRQYEHILRVNNGYQNAYYNMGYIYLEQLDDMDSAGYFFDKVLALNPYHYKALYNRGLAYERSDHPDLALIDYEKALEIKPDFELAAIGKGRLVE